MLAKVLIPLTMMPTMLQFQDLNDSDGVANFQKYYRCYFNKYFKIAESEGSDGREGFVGKLLEEALTNNEKAPSTACVNWICDTELQWKIWKPESVEKTATDWAWAHYTEVWAYYTHPGKIIASWKTCFQDRSEEFARQNYTSHPVGKIDIVYCF